MSLSLLRQVKDYMGSLNLTRSSGKLAFSGYIQIMRYENRSLHQNKHKELCLDRKFLNLIQIK